MANEDFLFGINQLAKSTYSRIASMHHYLSMAKKMFSEVKDIENVKLKKLFYALRTAVACQWIIEKEEMPPIVFQRMLEELQFDIGVKQRIYDLVELKSRRQEGYLHSKEEVLNGFIENCIQVAEQSATTLPSSKGQIDDLNQFFLKMLQNS